MSNDFNFTEGGYIPGSSFDFNFGITVPTPENIYSILKGSTNNFLSVWVLDNKMYAGTNDSLTVINLLTNMVWDWYDQSQKGRAGETLNSDDSNDINVI
jgi:hypothetical protein